MVCVCFYAMQQFKKPNKKWLNYGSQAEIYFRCIHICVYMDVEIVEKTHSAQQKHVPIWKMLMKSSFPASLFHINGNELSKVVSKSNKIVAEITSFHVVSCFCLFSNASKTMWYVYMSRERERDTKNKRASEIEKNQKKPFVVIVCMYLAVDVDNCMYMWIYIYIYMIKFKNCRGGCFFSRLLAIKL